MLHAYGALNIFEAQDRLHLHRYERKVIPLPLDVQPMCPVSTEIRVWLHKVSTCQVFGALLADRLQNNLDATSMICAQHSYWRNIHNVLECLYIGQQLRLD
ncbi:MAG: hypothetical protein R2856_02250 [Caldilineaceae bacterium]